MAKKAYIGVDGKARKIKKGYVGVNGKACKIKKAYIGIGGVARPCFGNGEMAYYGKITSLSRARRFLTGVSVGNYALFCGGATTTSGSDFANVDTYSDTLTKSNATTLTYARRYPAATNVGNYAIIGGGGEGKNSSNQVDAYNANLTKSNPTTLSARVFYLGAASVGNYALFAGGRTNTAGSSSTGSQSIVNAYDTSLTRTFPTDLSSARYNVAGASTGNYALFAGGISGTRSNDTTVTTVVDAYNASLTRTSATVLSEQNEDWTGVSFGTYALFGGGQNNGVEYYSSTVNVYNSSLTRSVATPLSKARQSLGATSVGDFALFGGGDAEFNDDQGVTVVDAYDTSLTRSNPTELSVGRGSLGATSVGKYALFAGGLDEESAYRDEVDAYVVL